MPHAERRVVEEFDAIGDDGEEYAIIISDEFMEHRSRDPKKPGGLISRWIPAGRIQIRLDDGTPVNQIDADTFKIATTGVTLKRSK